MEECEERGAGAKDTRQKGTKGNSRGDLLTYEEFGGCIAPSISELFSSAATTVDKYLAMNLYSLLLFSSRKAIMIGKRGVFPIRSKTFVFHS